MRVIERGRNAAIAVGAGKLVLALCRLHALGGGEKVRAKLERPHLNILLVELERDESEVTDDVVIRRHRFVAEQLPQARLGLNQRQSGRGNVRLELQQLDLDLEQVAFADRPGLVTLFA